MTVKSIIEIDVDDESFKQFHKAFDQYAKTLAKMPLAWKDVSAAIKTAKPGFAAVLQDTLDTAKAINNAADATKDHVSATEKLASHWEKVSSATGRAADHVKSIFKWVSIGAATGVISSLAGMFGIDTLASSVTRGRRTALHEGVSFGFNRAFDRIFERAFDPAGFLSGVNEALLDPTKTAALRRSGVSEAAIQSRDTERTSLELLNKLEQRVLQTPAGQLGYVYRAAGAAQYGLSLEDFRAWQKMGGGELGELNTKFGRTAKQIKLENDTAKAWTDVDEALGVATDRLENSFAVALKSLAGIDGEGGPLGNLVDAFTSLVDTGLKSGAFQEFIKDVASGMKALGDDLKSGKFKQELSDLFDNIGVTANNIKIVAAAIAATVKWLAAHSPSAIGQSIADAMSGGFQALDPRAPVTEGSAHFFKYLNGTAAGNYLTARVAGLVNYGMKPDDAAALAANFYDESWNGRAFNLHTWGDNHTAFGEGQWRDTPGSPRLSNLRKFLAENYHTTLEKSTQEQQDSFAIYELRAGQFAKVGAALASIQGVGAKAAFLSKNYERPKDSDFEAINRAQRANVIIAIYNNTGGSAHVQANMGAH